MKNLILICLLVTNMTLAFGNEDGCIACIKPIEGGVQGVESELVLDSIKIWDAYIQGVQKRKINKTDKKSIEITKQLADQVEEYIEIYGNSMSNKELADLYRIHAGLAGDVALRERSPLWGKAAYTSVRTAAVTDNSSAQLAMNYALSLKKTHEGYLKAPWYQKAGMAIGWGYSFDEEFDKAQELLNKHGDNEKVEAFKKKYGFTKDRSPAEDTSESTDSETAAMIDDILADAL